LLVTLWARTGSTGHAVVDLAGMQYPRGTNQFDVVHFYRNRRTHRGQGYENDSRYRTVSDAKEVGVNTQQVGRAGEMFVAAEIHRRGGYAATFAGNMPGIDILASDLTDSRRISIQVKTKSSGTWHARYPQDAAECGEDPAGTSFWIFVDLGSEHPAYFVAPRWWVRNNIWQVHIAYLAQYEQKHGRLRESGHHGIPVSRIGQWRDRWDVLGIF
jgi:hypothetical protein